MDLKAEAFGMMAELTKQKILLKLHLMPMAKISKV